MTLLAVDKLVHDIDRVITGNDELSVVEDLPGIIDVLIADIRSIILKTKIACFV